MPGSAGTWTSPLRTRGRPVSHRSALPLRRLLLGLRGNIVLSFDKTWFLCAACLDIDLRRASCSSSSRFMQVPAGWAFRLQLICPLLFTFCGATKAAGSVRRAAHASRVKDPSLCLSLSSFVQSFDRGNPTTLGWKSTGFQLAALPGQDSSFI